MIAVQDGHEDAVTLIQSMMMRNDPSIRGRLHAIVNQYAAVFGTKRQFKSEKLNARAGPSVNDSVITTLIKGQALLEVFSQDKWSQVVVLDNAEIDQTLWISSPLLEVNVLAE